MRTVFGLFGDYANAEATVSDLVRAGYKAGDINVIVKEEVLDGRPKPSRKEKKASGLTAVLANKKAVREPEAGLIYAANAMAQHLAETAPVNAGVGGLKASLEDVGVDPHLAEAYRQGVSNGMLLLFLNTAEARALETSDIFDRHTGRSVSIITPQ